jgi:hypothetical protein
MLKWKKIPALQFIPERSDLTQETKRTRTTKKKNYLSPNDDALFCPSHHLLFLFKNLNVVVPEVMLS